MKRRMIAVLALCAAAALAARPAQASQPGTVTAVREMEVLPRDFSPFSEPTPEKKFLWSLTTAGWYTVAPETGAVTPCLAAALPVDVTARYAPEEICAIPWDAQRGYAFQIDLNPDACWEDGAPITAQQVVSSLIGQMELGRGPEFANAEAYRLGIARPGTDIISLEEAGYSSVTDAQEQGITDFYLDMTHFWGIDSGWLPIFSRTRLRDYAMPAGLDEMYVTAAYLYQNYLAQGAKFAHLQGEFVGVPASMEAPPELDEVGILQTGAHQITLIMARPTTAQALALGLEEMYLVREDPSESGAAAGMFSSYGPYRIVSSGRSQIVLEPNPHWWGAGETRYDRVVCRIGT